MAFRGTSGQTRLDTASPAAECCDFPGAKLAPPLMHDFVAASPR